MKDFVYINRKNNITTIGSNNNSGILAAAFPASSNKTITSLIRLRIKIIAIIKMTVITVEMIARMRNVLIRRFPIVSFAASRTSTL